jgi:hypothetical protein
VNNGYIGAIRIEKYRHMNTTVACDSSQGMSREDSERNGQYVSIDGGVIGENGQNKNISTPINSAPAFCYF